LCGSAGCGRAIPDNARRCDECTAERNKTATSDGIREHTLTDRERYAFLYKSERWKRGVSPRMLKKFPFCARCQVELSVLVDHVVPAGVAIIQAQESGRWPFDKWHGFYIETNLQGLCHSCHWRKTDEDKQHVGAWPSVLETLDKQPKKVWSF
jgi:5-methylcytosine-specific restriction endonuclease McrA